MPGVTSRLVDEMEEHPPEVLTFSPARRVRGLGERQRPDRGIRRDRPLPVGLHGGMERKIRTQPKFFLGATDLGSAETPIDPTPLDAG